MNPIKTPKIYGVIGYPIAHTLSPYIHNAAFSKLGLDAIYLPFEVKPGDLKGFLEDLRKKNLSERGFSQIARGFPQIKKIFSEGYLKSLCACRIEGLNVTIPHKESVIKFLDSISREAALIGAVNTIVVKKRTLKGYNTDAPGFIQALKKDLAFKPEGKNVCVLGAGGAARAVCFSLARERVRAIRITDIIFGQAKTVADKIKRNFPNCNTEPFKLSRIKDFADEVDLLVNAAPVGMKRTDPLLIEPKFLNRKASVFDLVYNIETRLVRLARRRGLKAENGIGMLLYQGGLSFELWTGRRAPVEVMRRALEEAIKCKLQ